MAAWQDGRDGTVTAGRLGQGSHVHEEEEMPHELTQEGQTALVIDRSRFVGLSVRLERADPLSALTDMAERVPGAGHYCYGARWSAAQERADDAGEPQGTAGVPILSVLRQHDLVHTLIVVARYYGGIKLGRQGLYRAYRATAELAVAAGVPRPVKSLARLRITVEYNAYERFQRWLTTVAHRATRAPWFDTEAHWEGWVEGLPPDVLRSLEQALSKNPEAAVLETRQGVL